jgi:hypothetical protein
MAGGDQYAFRDPKLPIDDSGAGRIEPGQFKITIGGCSPGKRGNDLGAPEPVQATLVAE